MSHRQEDAPPRPDRIIRQCEPTELGISPVDERGGKLTIEMSFAQASAQQSDSGTELARSIGLEPLAPVLRRNDRTADVQPPQASEPQAAGTMPAISTVPTIGPGMIRRLSAAGVRTMADLAEADAAVLRRKLGQVGRLAKVEDWIAHARAVVSQWRSGPDGGADA